MYEILKKQSKLKIKKPDICSSKMKEEEEKKEEEKFRETRTFQRITMNQFISFQQMG